MLWVWDEDKNRRNKQKHGLSFETAMLVFDDALTASRPDPWPDEERWQTIGYIGSLVVMVVHTDPLSDPLSEKPVGRIISARKATPHERKIFEEGLF